MVEAGSRQAVFLDRDGVLNDVDVVDGITRPPAKASNLRLLSGAAEAVQALRAAGYLTLVVSNQPDVARGTQTRAEVEAINAAIKAMIPFDDIDLCYHDNADNCRCRKPLPGLLEASAARHGVSLKRSAMVGDRETDILAGHAAGCISVFVGHPGTHVTAADCQAASLLDALPWLLERLKQL